MDIKKGILSLVVASFIGIIANPEMLAASDSVTVKSLNNAGIVETVVRTPNTGFVPSSEITGVKASETFEHRGETASREVSYSEAEEPYVEPAAQAMPENYISVAGRVLEIEDVSSLSADSGDHVNHMAGTKYYWGHNTSAVFRGLYNLGAGSTFTVTNGGVTRTYMVAREPVIFENQGTYYTHNDLVYTNGDFYKGFFQEDLVGYDVSSATYDMVLLTCYGTMISSNNAAQRYVIFANQI